MLKEFKAFIARGNVIDLAVAVVIGAAFGKIVTSLVDGVIMPPIGRLTGGIDFSSLFVVLDSAKGIPVIAYGQFINDVINFVIIAFVIFLIVKWYNRMKTEPAPVTAAPTTKDCPRCLSTIPIKATKCAHCTADLPAQTRTS